MSVSLYITVSAAYGFMHSNAKSKEKKGGEAKKRILKFKSVRYLD